MTSILIGLISCERDRHWLAACKDTWLRDVPQGIDVVIVNESFLPDDVPDTYEALPMKTKALAQYARRGQYQNILKVDIDTYLRPLMMVAAIEALPFTVEYAGKVRGPSGEEWVCCAECGVKPLGHSEQKHDYRPVANECSYLSGGCYVLRRRAIQIIAEAQLTMDDAEDRWVGNALYGFGIEPYQINGVICPSSVPVSNYLKNPNTIACMQMEDPAMMREVHAGKFRERHAAGSLPQDFPQGSTMRSQMR